MDVHLTCPYQQILQLYIPKLLVKDKIGAQLRDVKLQILLRKDSRLTLIADEAH